MTIIKCKNIIRLIAIILIILCGGYFTVNYLHKNSVLFNFFFSPKDLFSPLICTQFDLSQKNTYVLEFENKHPGNHWLEVLVEKPTKVLENYETHYKLRIIISSEEGQLLDKIVTEKDLLPFWSIKSGFSIYNYKVPTDLPREKRLKASIQIIEPDESFSTKYGKQEMCFKKYSDE
jgi:hypothetical protein